VCYRILRSLLRDLIIPWLISATLIVLFLTLVFNFGLIAWPIAFLLFLFVAVTRSQVRDQEAARNGSALEIKEGQR
jgi:hypothetical protein